MDDRTNASHGDGHGSGSDARAEHDEDAAAATADASNGDAGSAPSLIEIVLFAPVDAAFSLLRDPSGAASRGRARVEQALRQARALGELSIKFGAREIRRRTEGAGDAEPAGAKHAARATPHPDAGPPPDDIIADYDGLSASQIVPMLTGLDPSERARVASYEAKSRGRQTILRKIDQLDGNGA